MERPLPAQELARFTSSNMKVLLIIWIGVFGYFALRGLLD